MFFDMKTLFLYSLIAVTYASPVPGPAPQSGTGISQVSDAVQENASATILSLNTRDLETRAKKKSISAVSCNGNTLSKDDVGKAIQKMKSVDDKAVRRTYPHEFKNKSGGKDVFESVQKKLREFPIIKGGPYEGGEPGPWRAVTDYSGGFVGVMWEGPGAKMTKCTPVSDTTPSAPAQTTATQQTITDKKTDDKKTDNTGKPGKTSKTGKGH